MIRALLRGLLVMLVAWLAVVPSEAVAEPFAPRTAHAYDGHVRSAPGNYGTAERAPPTTYDRGTTYDAVDRWSHGASARPDTAGQSPAIIYNHPEPFAQVAGPGAATAEQAEVPRAGPPSFALRHVAANTGRTAAWTCLRSFAGTTLVLMADGTKKPIEDIKVGVRLTPLG